MRTTYISKDSDVVRQQGLNERAVKAMKEVRSGRQIWRVLEVIGCGKVWIGRMTVYVKGLSRKAHEDRQGQRAYSTTPLLPTAIAPPTAA